MFNYRSTCRSCGGQLYVVSGSFEMAPAALRQDGFDLSKLTTKNELVHCSTCDSSLALADCVVDCPDCQDVGWGHFESGSGPQVQRCDCGALATDDEAVEAHRLDCGCGWGESWHRQIYEVTIKSVVIASPNQAESIAVTVGRAVAHQLARPNIDLPDRGEMIVGRSEVGGVAVRDEHPSRQQLAELGGLAKK